MGRERIAVIIGAGPAGLTAAYELLTRTDIQPIVIERDPDHVGGISRTVSYRGNRIDIGGHRFFSKSDRVMQWWTQMLPVRVPRDASVEITYQRATRALSEGLRQASESDGDNVMLIRPRRSRIAYGGQFFQYPLDLSLDTLRKLGFFKVARIVASYMHAVLLPSRQERTLEDFFIGRFGVELYTTFFKSYTEKVWGRKCNEISAEWGAQRVKGLSITKAIVHAARKVAGIGSLAGKSGETSLIEHFLYPAFGPGQMWETVARKVKDLGGEIRMGAEAVRVHHQGGRVTAVTVRRESDEETISADQVFSTTDVGSLIRILEPHAPRTVGQVAEGLQYRDFLTVGLLLESRPSEKNGGLLTDTWIYVQEPEIQVGRIQLFHNWSPHLVADAQHGWVGLEYFCYEGDELWRMADSDLIELGARELKAVGLGEGLRVVDGTVLRQPKAYPGYFGSYESFATVREYLDSFANLFPIGRNGMHRYNNQDHSMLVAMNAVDNIVGGVVDKSNLWSVNAGQEYHESKS
jgi:protoporphyrinogen oxidase